MSLPKFPVNEQVPSREEVINQIISSIAMEELGLSHVINAEGEKLQYAFGTIPGVSGPAEPLTIDDLMGLNESVRKTLDSTMMNQFFLKEKLHSALNASIMQGPEGPAGPMTIILDSYDDLDTLKSEHPTGTPGDAYLVGGVLYVWDEEGSDWKGTGDLTGPQGPQGTGTTIKGSYETKEEFEENPPAGSLDDAYLVAGEIYIWNETEGWHSGGSLKGDQGVGTTIKGSYETKEEFEENPPAGSLDDAYLVAGELYIWSETEGWHSGGSLKGDQGTGTTIKGSYETKEEFEENPPAGSLDDAYLVAGEIYIWNETEGWHSGGSLKGDQGVGTTIKGSYETKEEFEENPPAGSLDDSYLVAGEIYIWNETEGWHSGGSLKGNTGTPGSGAIIPFTTGGGEIVMSAVAPNRSNIILVGYGNHDKLIASSDPINIEARSQYTFTMPADGTITHFSVFFSLISPTVAPGVTSTIRVQLYSTPALPLSPSPPMPNNSFMPVPNTIIDVGPIEDYAAEHSTYNNELVLDPPIQFNAGTRLMVAYWHLSEPTGGATLNGVMSGAIGIGGVL